MGKFLHWLQERIKHWIKPATSVLIIGILSDLTHSHTDLVVENALLRQQLIVLNRQVKRPQLTNPDRFRLVFLSHFTTLIMNSQFAYRCNSKSKVHKKSCCARCWLCFASKRKNISNVSVAHMFCLCYKAHNGCRW